MSSFSLTFFILVCISIANTGENVCPGYGFIRSPDNCESTCSAEKDECPTGKKCCFQIEQPCGYQCIVPKYNEPKQGQCPSSSSQLKDPMWSLCDGHMCDIDSDCQDAEKCCPNTCGSSVCVLPE